MKAVLDPWDDADTLAQRLQCRDALLLILIGAEQWCARCRDMRPHFDDLLAKAEHDETWLRFDLEEHAEFLGNYLPDDLPVLVAYRGEELVSCAVLESRTALGHTVARARLATGLEPHRPKHPGAPAQARLGRLRRAFLTRC